MKSMKVKSRPSFSMNLHSSNKSISPNCINSTKEPFSWLNFLICITIKSSVYAGISGYFVVLARNCLTSTLDYIVMQMRKINCEKGY